MFAKIKKIALLALTLCLIPVSSTNADFDFTSATSGNITDGGEITFGTFELFTGPEVGSTELADSTMGGADGAEARWDIDANAAAMDMAAIRVNVTSVNPLYVLDSLTFGQSVYENTAASNGGEPTDVSPTYSVLGYTGAFIESDADTSGNADGQITSPVSGADLTWTQNFGYFSDATNPLPNIIRLLPNANDSWSVTVTDVLPGTNYDYKVAAGAGSGNLNVEYLSVDAAFSLAAVPEPSSLALLGFGGLSLLLRRRK